MIGIVDYLSSYWMEGMLAKGRMGHELEIGFRDREVIMMISIDCREASPFILKILLMFFYGTYMMLIEIFNLALFIPFI